MLGGIGGWLGGSATRGPRLLAVGALALLLAAREWHWLTIPLPELKRQTEKTWAHDLGFVRASALWGFHIGFGFLTRVTYGGFWVLVALILALGEVGAGA